MIYELPKQMQKREAPSWSKGVGGIPALLPDGSRVEVPVLERVNVLTTGTTGTGKTVSFTLPAAEQLLLADPKTKGVFFEIKHAFLDRFFTSGDKVLVQNPATVPSERLFRPCLIKEIRQAPDREAEMRQIAEFLFADLLRGANQNRAWVEGARNTFTGVLRVIIDCYPQENTSNRVLIQALRRMPLTDLLSYLSRHPRNRSMLQKDFGFDPEQAGSYRPTRRAGDIMFFFNQVLERFTGSFLLDGDDTVCDFLQGRYGRHLFLLYDLASAEISRPFFLYYLKKIKDYKLSNSHPGSDPILMVLDEIDKLADGGVAADFGLYQAATLGREYGLQLLVTSQSHENLYGLSPEFNEHITVGGLSGFPVQLAFRPGDPSTIQTLQTLYGSAYREHLVLPASRYAQPQMKYEMEPVVTDAEFASLGLGEAYLKIMSCPPQRLTFLFRE